MSSIWGYESVPTLNDRKGAVSYVPPSPVIGSSGSLGTVYPLGASAASITTAVDRISPHGVVYPTTVSAFQEQKESYEQQQLPQASSTQPLPDTLPLQPTSSRRVPEQSAFIRSSKQLSSTANRFEEQPRDSFHTDGDFQRPHQDHDYDHHNVPPRSFEPAWLAAGADMHRRARNSTRRTQSSSQAKRSHDYYSRSSVFDSDRSSASWRMVRDPITGQLTQAEAAPLQPIERHHAGSDRTFPNCEGRRPNTALFTAQRPDPPYRVRPPPAYPLQYSWYYEGAVSAQPIDMVAKPVAVAPPHFSTKWVPNKPEQVPFPRPFDAAPDVVTSVDSRHASLVKGVPTLDKKHRSVSRNGLGGFYTS